MNTSSSNVVGVASFVGVVAGVALLNRLRPSRNAKSDNNVSKVATNGVNSEKKSSEQDPIIDLNLPVIDIRKLFTKDQDPAGYVAECNKLASALRNYGCAAIQDPRFDENENIAFLNMMETYFEMSDGKRDARPETGYQVGVTPEHVETARDYSDVMTKFTGENVPISPLKVQPDHKWRFFWRMNPAVNSEFGYPC